MSGAENTPTILLQQFLFYNKSLATHLTGHIFYLLLMSDLFSIVMLSTSSIVAPIQKGFFSFPHR